MILMRLFEVFGSGSFFQQVTDRVNTSVLGRAYLQGDVPEHVRLKLELVLQLGHLAPVAGAPGDPDHDGELGSAHPADQNLFAAQEANLGGLEGRFDEHSHLLSNLEQVRLPGGGLDVEVPPLLGGVRVQGLAHIPDLDAVEYDLPLVLTFTRELRIGQCQLRCFLMKIEQALARETSPAQGAFTVGDTFQAGPAEQMATADYLSRQVQHRQADTARVLFGQVLFGQVLFGQVLFGQVLVHARTNIIRRSGDRCGVYLLQNQFIIKIIMSAYRRLEAQLEASRRISYERELELSRRYELERIERERDYLRLKEAEKIRAEQEYEQYRLRRAEQHRLAEHEMVQEKLAREAACREYEARVQAERLTRQARDKELEVQQRIAEEAEIRKAEALAVSRRAQLQKKEQIAAEMSRENLAILDEQKIQEKLEKELAQIDIKIGSIHDEREARKRRELEELEDLDKQSFKLKQGMRSSKVQQKALEQSLAQLSKLIV